MMDYSAKKVMVGLSAGINSAALLVWLGSLPAEQRPSEIHLYYAHFIEHSADSLPFVWDLVRWAEGRFEKVVYTQTDNSILSFFETSKMIPHPANSPCSRLLKILPMMAYMAANGLDLDLVGYVREEKRRATKMREKYGEDSKQKDFPILQESNEWCFDIVRQQLGWYPAIYDKRWNDSAFVVWMEANIHRLTDDAQRRVRKKLGTSDRVFKHNNCLPCKNMALEDMLPVEFYFPQYQSNAVALSARLRKYWGRDKEAYYTLFALSQV